MFTETKLTLDKELVFVDSTKYRGTIGSLLYLTASRPDIMFSVCLCARFQEYRKTSYLEAVKRIFKYIKGTSHLRVWYPKGTGVETIFRDMRVGFGKWEFDPMEIDNPFPNNEGSVHLWHGEEDGIVHVLLQRYIAKKLPWNHY
ncbi:hypothetical protein Tco_0206101 [Tanacetum coccineum]